MTDLPPDPFAIQGPALISFSGGRTSGYMLWRILQAHGGVLPPGVVVGFANTGREMPFTLDFVQQCGERWNVPITWLEYRHNKPEGAHRRVRYAEVVNHNNASRAGEPFDMLLDSKQIVPDRSRRFCTEELKVKTIRRYLRGVLKWKHWANVVGFRADESARIERKQENVKAAADLGYHNLFPLAEAGVDLLEVRKFWRDQPFDLQLDADGDGGNCDGCFMFPTDRIGRMFLKYPERMDWWVQKESLMRTKTMRPRKQSFSSIRDAALAGAALAWDDSAACEEDCGV